MVFISKIKAQNINYEKIGDNLQIALPVSAFASSFIWKDNQRAPLQFIKTMGGSLIVTHSLKELSTRKGRMVVIIASLQAILQQLLLVLHL